MQNRHFLLPYPQRYFAALAFLMAILSGCSPTGHIPAPTATVAVTPPATTQTTAPASPVPTPVFVPCDASVESCTALLATPITDQLKEPSGIAFTGLPDDHRLFVLERAGRILIVDPDGTIHEQPFLDLTGSVATGNWEQGLLGLVFHPNFARTGYFYIHYTDSAGDVQIVRYHVQPEAPDVADPSSAFTILSVDKPHEDHNGGQLAFGPDGYLYIALGDGGGDALANAQSLDTLMGKVLRLDVDSADPYAIPADNPFVETPGARGEIWLMGLRNPWRFSFDRQTGDLFIGDVGGSLWEELNFLPAGDKGGENFGWPCLEGNEPLFPEFCDESAVLTPPILTFKHQERVTCSITAGYVYRGAAFPDLDGTFLLSDMCSESVWGIRHVDGQWRTTATGASPGWWTTFGQDAAGDLYAAAFENGTLYRLSTTPAP